MASIANETQMAQLLRSKPTSTARWLESAMRPSLLVRPCETGAAMLRMRAHGQQILRGRLDIDARVHLVKSALSARLPGRGTTRVSYDTSGRSVDKLCAQPLF
jgi:hypothetical protein